MAEEHEISTSIEKEMREWLDKMQDLGKRKRRFVEKRKAFNIYSVLEELNQEYQVRCERTGGHVLYVSEILPKENSYVETCCCCGIKIKHEGKLKSRYPKLVFDQWHPEVPDIPEHKASLAQDLKAETAELCSKEDSMNSEKQQLMNEVLKNINDFYSIRKIFLWIEDELRHINQPWE